MELSEVQHPSKKLLTMDQATILGVLESYKHPFMLVGVIAHRWMGCASGVDEGFDIGPPNDQLKTIVVDIINTGSGLRSMQPPSGKSSKLILQTRRRERRRLTRVRCSSIML